MKQKYQFKMTNMKIKYLLTFVLLLCVIAIHAEKVTEAEACQKAQQFMQGKKFKQKNLRRTLSNDADNKAYYVFNVENNGGYVIVSGDTRTPEILGYSDHGNLDVETAPCNVKWLLDYYEQAISHLSDTSYSLSNRASGQRVEIKPLLDTNWGQGEPYNNLCPVIDGEHCMTGCAATAISQVLFYNQWPQDYTSSIPEYTTTTLGLVMPELPPQKFNWDYMSETEIARLMLYCGQAVKMDYNVNESGAFPTEYATALNDFFGYQNTRIEARANYSDDEWDELIYNELSSGRSIVYSGYSYKSGHTFVIDGYQDKLYHMIFGWNGAYSGYYTLNVWYTIAQTAIVNIQSPVSVAKPQICVTNLQYGDQRMLERNNVTDLFPKLNFSCIFTNKSAKNIALQLGFGLFNDEGLIEVLYSREQLLSANEDYWLEFHDNIKSVLEDGNYYIIPIYRENGEEEWKLASGYTTYYYTIIVNQLTMIIESPFIGSNDDEVEYGNHLIDGVNYRIYSEYGNNRASVVDLPGGEKYSGSVYIPEKVSYQNMEFDVVDMLAYPFKNCPELKSLSIAVPNNGIEITNCPKLTNLEFREGVLDVQGLLLLHQLETVTFPSSCEIVWDLMWCNSMKSIVFKNPRPMNFYQPFDWDEESMPALTDVYFYSAMPPTFRENEDKMKARPDVKIHIPKGSLEAYKHSVWKDWIFVEDLPAAEGVLWSYCGNTPNFSFRDDNGEGWDGMSMAYPNDNESELAIKVPGNEMTSYKGGKITKINFYTPLTTTNVKNDLGNIEYVFISKPGSDYLIKQSVKTIRGTWMEVELDQPYTITDEDFFVGVGRSHGGIEMRLVNGGLLESGIWIRIRGDGSENEYATNWEWERSEDMQIRTKASNPEPSMPLPIQFLIEGGIAPTEMIISSLKKNDTTEVDQLQMKVKVRSHSSQFVNSFSLGIYDDGRLQDIQTFETALLYGYEDEVKVCIPKRKEEGSHLVTVRVLDINNNVPITNKGNEATTYYLQPFSSTIKYPRKLVMEEFTATWCGGSPRGIETINRMKEQYPNNFIPIMEHVSWGAQEPLYDPGNGYFPFLGRITQGNVTPLGDIPSCMINRRGWYDPKLNIIKDTIEKYKESAIAQISAKACFIDDDSTKVLVTTKTEFGFNSKGAERYSIAYAVLEDHVGPYSQLNDYSGIFHLNEEDSYLDWWTHQDGSMEMFHDNVARGIYDDCFGSSESIPSMIVAGETYHGQYVLTLPQSVEHKNNVHVAILLLDALTGEILNADDIKIVGTISEQPHVIVSNVSKVYGYPNPTFDYNTYGVIDGVPEFSCDATETSPVGTYPVSISQGTINDPNVVFINGTLTINAAPLTVKAGTYTKKQGEDNPEFTLTYEGWKNNETATVLTKKPTTTTTATKDSPVGEYKIVVSGGEAQNYELSYQNGVLTVTESAGIATISVTQPVNVYNVQGRMVRSKATTLKDLSKGIYIVNGRKVVVK